MHGLRIKSPSVKDYKRYTWTHTSVGRWSKTRLNLETLNLETLEPEDNPRVRLGESIASIFLTALGANITSFSAGVLSGFWAWTSLEVPPPRIMFQHLGLIYTDYLKTFRLEFTLHGFATNEAFLSRLLSDLSSTLKCLILEDLALHDSDTGEPQGTWSSLFSGRSSQGWTLDKITLVDLAHDGRKRNSMGHTLSAIYLASVEDAILHCTALPETEIQKGKRFFLGNMDY